MRSSADGLLLYDVNAADWDAFIAADATAREFGFIDGGKLAVTRDSDGNGSQDTISTYSYNDGAFRDVLAELDIAHFAAVDKGPGSSGYFAFSSAAAGDRNSIYVKTDTGAPS